MQDVSNANFGPLVAYLVPGAIALLGFSEFSPGIRAWFAATPADAPTISGFLYLTVASLAVGMTVSALRWAILDTLHARTGLPLPPFDFSRLGANVEAFSLLIEIHYKHYLCYGNSFVAVALAYACYRVHIGLHGFWGWPDTGVLFLEIVLFAASRDTLGKYFARGQQLLSVPGDTADGPVKKW